MIADQEVVKRIHRKLGSAAPELLRQRDALLEACRKAEAALTGYKTIYALHEDSVLNKARVACRKAIELCEKGDK